MGSYALVRWDLEVDTSAFASGEEEELKDLVGGWENRSRASFSMYATEVFRQALELDSMKIPIEPDHPYLHGSHAPYPRRDRQNFR
jgi:hypothetical protein